jgi:hypothetical protein
MNATHLNSTVTYAGTGWYVIAAPSFLQEPLLPSLAVVHRDHGIIAVLMVAA